MNKGQRITALGSSTSYEDDTERNQRSSERVSNNYGGRHNSNMTTISTYSKEGIRYWEEKTFDGILVGITSKEI